MLLSAHMLSHVCSVNNYRRVSTVEFTEGDTPSISFQLVDLSVDRASEGFAPPGRRYCPDPAASLEVSFASALKDRSITYGAYQPFPCDGSIWRIDLTDDAVLTGRVDLLLTLTEPNKTTRGTVPGALTVRPVRGAC